MWRKQSKKNRRKLLETNRGRRIAIEMEKKTEEGKLQTKKEENCKQRIGEEIGKKNARKNGGRKITKKKRNRRKKCRKKCVTNCVKSQLIFVKFMWIIYLI